MKVTEQSSNYTNLDKMTTRELLEGMNREDRHVPEVVAGCIPQIEKLVEGIVPRVKRGGRVFYVGAGTSGRLGILDASEIPPTYGAPYDPAAFRRLVESRVNVPVVNVFEESQWN